MSKTKLPEKILPAADFDKNAELAAQRAVSVSISPARQDETKNRKQR